MEEPDVGLRDLSLKSSSGQRSTASVVVVPPVNRKDESCLRQVVALSDVNWGPWDFRNRSLTLGNRRRFTETKGKCWRWSRNDGQHWNNVKLSEGVILKPKSNVDFGAENGQHWNNGKLPEGALLKPKPNVDVRSETMGNTETMRSCLKASYWTQSQMLTLEQKRRATLTERNAVWRIFTGTKANLEQEHWADQRTVFAKYTVGLRKRMKDYELNLNNGSPSRWMIISCIFFSS